MERDFLGAIGRVMAEHQKKEEEEAASKAEPEDARRWLNSTVQSSDYLGGGPAPAQWQYQANAGATPPFMSFRPPMEDPRDSFSGFRQQPAVVPAGARMPHHQSQFGFDGHVSAHQYAALPHAHGHGIDSYDVAAPPPHLQRPFHHPMHFNPANPMHFNPGNPMLRVPSVAAGVPFKNQYLMMNSPVPSSTVGVYGPRDLQNPESTRMTIFYNGVVNVFDVPMEKAQELMVLASRVSIPSPPSAVTADTADTRFAAPEVSPARKIIVQKQETFVPHVSAISSPVPVLSQPVALSKSTSSSNNESAGPTSSSVAVPSVVPPVIQASSAQPLQQAISAAAAAAVTPRAVPQARRASLTRFLEKRKERVTSVMPYPSSKSPLDSSDTLGSTSTPSKSSGTDIALAMNNGQESMSIGLSRNISFSSEKLPSTDLQI